MPAGLPAEGSGLGRGKAGLIQGLMEDFLEEGMPEEGLGWGWRISCRMCRGHSGQKEPRGQRLGDEVQLPG